MKLFRGRFDLGIDVVYYFVIAKDKEEAVKKILDTNYHNLRFTQIVEEVSEVESGIGMVIC